jgi:glucose/arabinose dehydrogenase
MPILSFRRRDLIINLFIGSISIFTLFNLVNNDLDNAFGGSEKEPPWVYDENLQITQLTEELNFPTGIDFLAEDDILVIEKNTGQVKRILDGKVLNEPVLDVNVASESERGLLGIAILNTQGLTNADMITTNNDKSQENNLNNEEVKVFLFYTETQDIDNGDILGNRLYKYDFLDGKID